MEIMYSSKSDLELKPPVCSVYNEPYDSLESFNLPPDPRYSLENNLPIIKDLVNTATTIGKFNHPEKGDFKMLDIPDQEHNFRAIRVVLCGGSTLGISLYSDNVLRSYENKIGLLVLDDGKQTDLIRRNVVGFYHSSIILLPKEKVEDAFILGRVNYVFVKDNFRKIGIGSTLMTSALLIVNHNLRCKDQEGSIVFEAVDEGIAKFANNLGFKKGALDRDTVFEKDIYECNVTTGLEEALKTNLSRRISDFSFPLF
jgi:GNAT superfamily N-acetyltransferase